MTDLAQTDGRGFSAGAVIVLGLIAVLLVLPTALFAIIQGCGLVQLPYELDLVLRRRPVVFPLHMVAAGLALILIPIAAFTRRWRGVHRAAGRAAAVCVAVGGFSALLVALASEATMVARAGFFVQGLVWLVLLALAIAAIRAGNVSRHARLMLAMAAVASGAILLRLIIAASNALGAPFEAAYGVAAWAWLMPLALAGMAASLAQQEKPRNSARLKRRPKTQTAGA